MKLYQKSHLRFLASVALILFFICTLSSASASTTQPIDGKLTLSSQGINKLYGLDFGPYVDGQNPDNGSRVDKDQIIERMKIIAPYTTWIRTYGTENGLEYSGQVAHEMGLKSAVGAWLGKDDTVNERQINELINLSKAGYVDLAIVGSETLLRNDLTEDQLINYIKQVKREAPGVKVTTADSYGALIDHPNVMAECDVIMYNGYPYWEGVNINDSIKVLEDHHKNLVDRAGGKQVIVSETGWPSSGDTVGNAVPSPENASKYFNDFLSWVRKDNIQYFYFEAFDETWKATTRESSAGAHWGLWNKDGSIKPWSEAILLALPVANFTTNVTQGYAPLSVQFTDHSENATVVSWDFDNNGVIDSTDKNPIYEYATPGNYTVNMTVNNANGMNSKLATIRLLNTTPAYYSGNGHYYDSIFEQGGITWDDAKTAAESLSYKGIKGHLATITSQNENNFIFSKFGTSDHWLGGFQPTGSPEPIGGWQWVTSEPWVYTNWSRGEPGNNYGGDKPIHPSGWPEDALQLAFWDSNYTWNDLPHDIPTSGYIVEYDVRDQTPVANFISSMTSGYVPLTVQFTDSSQNAAGWSWNFGDGATSNEQNPLHIYSTEGIYTVSLIVNNVNGTNSKTDTITVLNESGYSGGSSSGRRSSDGGSSGGSSHSSGGGGAGGAGGSPEPQNNVGVKELSQTSITYGNSINFNFPQNATPVTNISFDSKKTVGKTTAIVEMLKNQSTLVSEPPSDEVYKFVNIWVGNSGFATPDNIENAKVYFKVEKSWLQDTNIDKYSVTFNRYDDSKWNALPTNLSGEDDKYLYFTAETTGLSSPFAITGKAASNATLNETKSETQSGSNSSLENNANNATNVKQTQSPNTSENEGKKSPGFESVFGIFSLLAVFLCKRK